MEVYALCEPNSNNVRYIGITKNLEQRYKRHCSSRQSSGLRRNIWLSAIRESNQRPNLIIIESNLSEEDAGEREKFWIQYFKEHGHFLLNVSRGGGYDPYCGVQRGLKHKVDQAFCESRVGMLGKTHSDKTKLQMSASSKGKSKSAAHTEANRLAHIGIPWSNARRKAFINTNEGVRRAETIKKRGGYAKVLWYDGRTRKYKNKQDAILQIVK